MSDLLSAIILLFTVLAAFGIGILSGYWAVNGILLAFGQQARGELRPALAVSQSTASGD